MIQSLLLKPKTIFLIDAIGALTTALLLFFLLRPLHSYFGMRTCILTSLSLIACFFFVFSILCFFLLKKNWKSFLKIISIANLLYCCLTLVLVIYFFPALTLLGVLYFIGEMIIICGLVLLEWKVIKQSLV